MHKFFGKLVRTGLVCGMLMMAVPVTSMAAIGPGFKEGTYIATITANSVNINKTRDSEEVLALAKSGDTYEVLEDLGHGWMKIRVNDTEGYLPVSENAEITEAKEGEIEEIQKEAIESSNSFKRAQLVSYALQFVGNPYVYGGTSLTNGTDCSGFTMSVFRKFGISLPRTSGSQSGVGRKISVSEARAGDLIFYARNGHVNHVALCIGGGRVVHASNPSVGITTSNIGYRTPYCARRVIG